jgi:hypothetical protein
MIGPPQRPLLDKTEAPAGFEPAIPASEQSRIHTLVRAATEIGCSVL